MRSLAGAMCSVGVRYMLAMPSRWAIAGGVYVGSSIGRDVERICRECMRKKLDVFL